MIGDNMEINITNVAEQKKADFKVLTEKNR